MEAIVLNVQTRAVSGGETGKRLRDQGMVPAIVYGRGTDAKLAVVGEGEVKKSVFGKSRSQLFRFKSESKDFDGQLALVKEVQREPIKGKTLHVDFLAISEDQKIIVPVPVKLQGESPAVKAGDGILNFSAHEIVISCVPAKIPSELSVDLGQLGLGDSVHAGEVTLPEGVTLKTDAKVTIVSVVMKREESDVPAQAAAATPDAAAAAAPAAGDAKAAPAADKAKAKK